MFFPFFMKKNKTEQLFNGAVFVVCLWAILLLEPSFNSRSEDFKSLINDKKIKLLSFGAYVPIQPIPRCTWTYIEISEVMNQQSIEVKPTGGNLELDGRETSGAK